MSTSINLPHRQGPRPKTTETNPHQQLDQHTNSAIIEGLTRRAFSLPDVEEHPSAISVPGARALWLKPGVPVNNPIAIFIAREFAHLHPLPDGSMHMALPLDVAQEAIDKGWAEHHPMVQAGMIPGNYVMVYAPRTLAEQQTVYRLLLESYKFAGGRFPSDVIGES